ncbi:glycosyltransferase family 2 protein [Paraglaciecola sp. MB-3u-78]|uniref:glycosyltransferase family 2 protein n=1 Tax=Paraglaciecola sp. MB-3u-78 TaxID=2058332 RepID=UPI0012FEC3A4|nr:glycosyltransferase family 2 protein [Paraglaciecola sp. MB-3u-78]
MTIPIAIEDCLAKKISIITINFNNFLGLKKTIESVIQQTCANFEFVVIDGGSNDGSAEVLKEHNNNIDYWVSEPDTGIYNAMNKGIAYATGDYLLFLNSGDCLFKKDVLKNVSEQIHGDSEIYYGNEIKPDGSLWAIPRKVKLSYFFESSLRHQATFIKKSLFEIVGYYDESLKIVSDWDFMLKAIFIHGAKTQYIDEIVSIYEGGGVSQQACNLTLRKEEREIQLKGLFPFIYEDYKVLSNYKKTFKNPRVDILLKTEKYKILTFLNRIYFKILNLLLRVL